MTESITKKRIDEYFDREKLQNLQNAFSNANHCYIYFIDRYMRVLTEITASDKEKAYIEKYIPKEEASEFVRSFPDIKGEEIIDYSDEQEGVFLRGVATRIESNLLLGAWIVIGFDEGHLDEEMTLAGVKTTNSKDFDESIVLLDSIMRNYFVNMSQLISLEDDFDELKKERKHMSNLLQKSNTMTEILGMMESDGTFTDLVENILREAGKYLDVSNVHLLQLDADGTHVDCVCEWADNKQNLLADKISGFDIDYYPFMTGRPYTISSDTSMPENFTQYFSCYNILGGAFLPINVNEKLSMYLCFVVMDTPCQWSVEDINFVNDVKRIIQTVLMKRVTTNSLASSYSTLESILENTGCAVIVVDQNRNILYVNETYKSLQLQSDDAKELETIILDDSKNMPSEFYAKNSSKWFEISYATMEWVDGREVRLVSIYDISKIKQYQECIEHQANDDYLTGLYNRRRFEEDFSNEILRTARSGGKCALLYMGLDDFGNINNGLGHLAGDELLKEIAQALHRIPCLQDACYRIGGDEFALLVKNEYMNRLDSIIAEVNHLFENPWHLENTEFYLTESMGIVLVPQDGTETDLLLQHATVALHTAKNLGKNRVEYYNSQQLFSAVERLDLEKNMRKAVENGCEEFEIYYQPIVNVSDGESTCCGAEALVRWNSPIFGMVQPGQFIPLAEELGLINEIGKHVLLEATKRCKYWNDFGHPEYKVNVNLSVVQLLQNDIIEIIKEAIDSSCINPYNLTLEVTESLAIHDMKRMQSILSQIKDLGVRVALDDFGTGYSSLNHLRSMPIDVIKIDKCFVEDIGEDDFSGVFVKSVSQLADSLDMEICVEGVEKEHQKNTLDDMNVDMIQGYLFDKPLTVDAFEEKYLY